jgi:hypothetical protein
MYFSIITMVSVGYGDIKPINKKERIYISMMTIFSSMNFAFVVNTIGSIFAEISSKENQFKKDKYLIKKYLNERNIDSKIKGQVLNRLENFE